MVATHVDSCSRSGNISAVNVLVVDDDPVFRTRVARLLSEAGCSVREASNGAEAVDTYLGYPGLEVVLTDLFMPEMDGIELIEYFDGHPRVRVIALSCECPEGFRLDDAARAVGAYAVVDKDGDLGDLLELVRAARVLHR